MKIKIIKPIGILSLITSYALLLWNVIDQGLTNDLTELLRVAWIVGIISLIFNSVYAILIDFDQTLFSIFGLCGLGWIASFLISVNTEIGIIPLTIYLIIGVYLHTNSKSKIDSKNINRCVSGS